MKYIFSIVLVAVVSQVIAEIDFSALAELQHAHTPLNWSSDQHDSQPNSTTSAVDIFLISSVLSGTNCNSTLVRECVSQSPEPVVVEEEKPTAIATLEPAPASQPLPVPATLPEPESLMDEKQDTFVWSDPEEKECTPQVPVAVCSEVPEPCYEKYRAPTRNWELLVGPGYRYDNIWCSNRHIHKDLGCDKARAKDHLENIDIFLLTASFRGLFFCNCLYVRGYADFGWILHGHAKQKDSFVLKNTIDRSENKSEFDCKENSLIDGKYVTDFSIAAGFPLIYYRKECCGCSCCCCCPACTIAPLIGFSYSSMRFNTHNSSHYSGTSDTSLDPPVYERQVIAKMRNNNPQRKQSSSYRHKKSLKMKSFDIDMWSPFIGVDFSYPWACFELIGGVEFHVGRAHWRCSNRVPNLALWRELHESMEFTYEQSRTVRGFIFNIGLRGPIGNCWVYETNFLYQDYASFQSHKLYWQSFEVNLQIGRRF